MPNGILLQVNKQLGGCQSNQGRLEQDLENKDVALDIDHTCHNIHNNSKDIQLHGGIERQVMKYKVQQINSKSKLQNAKFKIQSLKFTMPDTKYTTEYKRQNAG